jgi:hypothetical protein
MRGLLVLLAASWAVPAAAEPMSFADFWEVAGVTREDTAEDVLRKWGPAKKERRDGNTTLHFDGGPTVTFSADGNRLFDFMGGVTGPFVAKHPSRKLALLGKSCGEAAAELSFVRAIEGYTTCKHYEKGWLLDVTLMCTGRISTLVVMWVPLPPEIKAQPPPPDHCNR